jgi:hypothetical protein
MKSIDAYIPKEVYDEFIAQHSNSKKALDYLSIILENRIRSERFLITRDLIKQVDHQKISIPVKDHLMPYLNEYCVIKGITKQELVVKLIKRKRII